MPRKLRIQYPGAIYHVMNRGDRREAIFADDTDRRRFLSTLGYRWSSYSQYLRAPAQRFDWLRADRLLGEWRIPRDSPARRRQFGLYVEARRGQEDSAAAWKGVERGWCLGDKAFKEELLAQVHEQRGDH